MRGSDCGPDDLALTVALAQPMPEKLSVRNLQKPEVLEGLYPDFVDIKRANPRACGIIDKEKGQCLTCDPKTPRRTMAPPPDQKACLKKKRSRHRC